MKITTIGRNRVKFIESLFAKAVDCKVYTLENCFVGEPVSVDAIRRVLFDKSFPVMLKHVVDGERDEYRVRLHGRCWYEFRVTDTAPVPETHPACCGCAECEARYAA